MITEIYKYKLVSSSEIDLIEKGMECCEMKLSLSALQAATVQVGATFAGHGAWHLHSKDV
jgi:hypothetical protein